MISGLNFCPNWLKFVNWTKIHFHWTKFEAWKNLKKLFLNENVPVYPDIHFFNFCNGGVPIWLYLFNDEWQIIELFSDWTGKYFFKYCLTISPIYPQRFFTTFPVTPIDIPMPSIINSKKYNFQFSLIFKS